jgi:hypothetical protein
MPEEEEEEEEEEDWWKLTAWKEPCFHYWSTSASSALDCALKPVHSNVEVLIEQNILLVVESWNLKSSKTI